MTTIISSAYPINYPVVKSSAVMRSVAAVGGTGLPVSILDQDNNLITTVAPGGFYNVLVVSKINGGNASTVFTNSIVQP